MLHLRSSYNYIRWEVLDPLHPLLLSDLCWNIIKGFKEYCREAFGWSLLNTVSPKFIWPWNATQWHSLSGYCEKDKVQRWTTGNSWLKTFCLAEVLVHGNILNKVYEPRKRCLYYLEKWLGTGKDWCKRRPWPWYHFFLSIRGARWETVF